MKIKSLLIPAVLVGILIATFVLVKRSNQDRLSNFFRTPREKQNIVKLTFSGQRRQLVISDPITLEYLATALFESKDAFPLFAKDSNSGSETYRDFRSGVSYSVEFFLSNGAMVKTLATINQHRSGLGISGPADDSSTSDPHYYIMIFSSPLPPKLTKALDYLLETDPRKSTELID